MVEKINDILSGDKRKEKISYDCAWVRLLLELLSLPLAQIMLLRSQEVLIWNIFSKLRSIANVFQLFINPDITRKNCQRHNQSSRTWRAIDDRRLSLKAIDERVFTKFRDKKCRIYKFAHLFYRFCDKNAVFTKICDKNAVSTNFRDKNVID